MRDSSLSACMQAVVAAEVGHLELAYDYFGEAALMDLGDLEHNTRDGLHMASLAGSWIAAVAGFGGMRDHGGELSLPPAAARGAVAARFRVSFRGRCLRVDVTPRRGDATSAAAAIRSRSATTDERIRSDPAGRRARGALPEVRRGADAAAGPRSARRRPR